MDGPNRSSLRQIRKLALLSLSSPLLFLSLLFLSIPSIERKQCRRKKETDVVREREGGGTKKKLQQQTSCVSGSHVLVTGLDLEVYSATRLLMTGITCKKGAKTKASGPRFQFFFLFAFPPHALALIETSCVFLFPGNNPFFFFFFLSSDTKARSLSISSALAWRRSRSQRFIAVGDA